jgi:rare lipoprotein A
MRTILFLAILILTTGCSNTPETRKYIGYYKVGKPYKINKVIYKPIEVKNYEKTGLASWYGPGFHGKKTANGEIFDRYDLTAAHHTLPLPCIVKVTNLHNNKSVILRVNDRGPFAKNKKSRIIDISEKAAEILDMKNKGIAKVKVTLLPSATANLHKTLLINQTSKSNLALNKKNTKKLS